MDTVFSISGKEIDLAKSLPLTIGDMKKLKKEQGINLAKMSDGGIDIDDMSGLLYYICNKANKEVTVDDIDGIPSSWLARVMEIFQTLQQQVDPPF
jgi:hypothetical protein